MHCTHFAYLKKAPFSDLSVYSRTTHDTQRTRPIFLAIDDYESLEGKETERPARNIRFRNLKQNVGKTFSWRIGILDQKKRS